LLYQTGTPVFVQGIRFLVRVVPKLNHEGHTDLRAQVAFVVPKKYIRKAVLRNLLKRRMREVYRLKKNEFYISLKNEELYCHISIVYLSRKAYSYKYIQSIFEKGIPLILDALRAQVTLSDT
jgi:ribonuclease P protein component